jgi:hypothetical protein
MIKLYIPIFLVLLLGGCGDRLAGWIAYQGELEARGRAYIDSRHDTRIKIRSRCEELFWAEIDKLEADGKFEEAQTKLALNYPGLLTFDAVRAYRDGDVTSFDTPWGCQIQ